MDSEEITALLYLHMLISGKTPTPTLISGICEQRHNPPNLLRTPPPPRTGMHQKNASLSPATNEWSHCWFGGSEPVAANNRSS